MGDVSAELEDLKGVLSLQLEQEEFEKIIGRMTIIAKSALWHLRMVAGDASDAVQSALRTHLRRGGATVVRSPEETDALWMVLRGHLNRKIRKYRRLPNAQRNSAVREGDLMGEAACAGWRESFVDKNLSPERAEDFVKEAMQVLDDNLPEADLREIAELTVQSFTPREIAGLTTLSVHQVRRKIDKIRERLLRCP